MGLTVIEWKTQTIQTTQKENNMMLNYELPWLRGAAI